MSTTASPRLARIRQTENGSPDQSADKSDSSATASLSGSSSPYTSSRGGGSSRVGLSEYTSQRLAELRARRAEADSSDYRVRSPDTAPPPPPTSGTSASALTASSEKPSIPVKPPSLTSPSSVAPSSGVVLHVSEERPRHVDPSSSASSASSTASTSSGSSPLPSSVRNGNHEHSMNNGRTGGGAEVFGRGGRGGGGLEVEAGGVHSSIRHSPSAAAAASPSRNISKVDEDGAEDCIGFASLPEQVHRKAVKRGFDFTLMVVGESGLGKSTLISCLFLNNDLYKDRVVPPAEDRISRTVEIDRKYMEIEERGVKLRLTIVDTPGYNDSVNANESWRPIENYIDGQFDQYFKDETGLNRKNIKDTRVHCCLYFISPYGRGLRQTDVALMRRLQEKVNLVPIIAKSDTLTPLELKRLKNNVLEDLDRHKIRIYEFPECDSDEDEEFKHQDRQMKASVPFAVIGSSTVVEVGGKKVRGRLYPWGIVEVDSPLHSDFSKLRQFLISTHMQDLKDVTRDVHYENYRAKFILQEQLGKSLQRDRTKLKRDSTPNFDAVVATESLLQQKEDEILQMREMIRKMHAQLSAGKAQNGSTA